MPPKKLEKEIEKEFKVVEKEVEQEVEKDFAKFIFIFVYSVLIIVLSFILKDQLASFKALGLLGIFLINFFSSATIFIPAPGIVTVVAGGAIYGTVLVGLLAGLGSALGDMVSFVLGKSGKEIFIKNHHPVYILLRKHFHKYGGVIVFAFALIPNPIFDAVGIFAGLFSYNPWRFFILVLVARILRNLLLARIGAGF